LSGNRPEQQASYNQLSPAKAQLGMTRLGRREQAIMPDSSSSLP
jgi:hypothetical protein